MYYLHKLDWKQQKIVAEENRNVLNKHTANKFAVLDRENVIAKLKNVRRNDVV